MTQVKERIDPEILEKYGPDKVPRLIKEARLELGETQAEFGAAFGVSQSAVNKWELGVNEAPVRVSAWLLVRTLGGNPPRDRYASAH